MIPQISVYLFKEQFKKLSDERIYLCADLFCKAEKKGKEEISFNEFPKIKRSQWKKPCFATDIGLYFSVSHSDEFWVCAVSRQEVGIDIQKKTKNYNTDIAKRFFHTDEHTYLKHNGFDDFFMIWTAKESYVKYTGQGIDDSFSAFSVIKSGNISNKINDADIRFLPVTSEYALCLCAKNIDKINIIQNA